MNPRHVAGIDPSTKCIGYADPTGVTHRIEPRHGASDNALRLDELETGLGRAIAIHPPRPDLILIEGYSLHSPGRLALIRLGEIGGVIRRMLRANGFEYVEIPPSSLKRFATGRGNATKDQMVAAAIRLGARGSVNDDEADAFHLRRMGRVAHGLESHLASHELDAIASCGVMW